jgi:hypothetical protein
LRLGDFFMGVNLTALNHVAFKTLAIGSLVAGITLIPSATKLGPTAQAAGSHPCWSSNEYFKRDIKTLGLTNVTYDAEFHWCATNGIVDTFIVDKTYAVAQQAARNATIDIKPYRPLQWGPTYQIYLDVRADKTITGGALNLRGLSGTAEPTNYHDRWEINLHGDGKIDGELNGGR